MENNFTKNSLKKENISNLDISNNSLERIYKYVKLDIPLVLKDWNKTTNFWIDDYCNKQTEVKIVEIVLDSAVFIFDLFEERVVSTYAISTPALTKRDASRIKGFPNVNASVKSKLGEEAFIADKRHFLGHASGGRLDINLFPHRRELNRGWSSDGKVFRAMEKNGI